MSEIDNRNHPDNVPGERIEAIEAPSTVLLVERINARLALGWRILLQPPIITANGWTAFVHFSRPPNRGPT